MAKLTKALDQVSIAKQQKLSLAENAPKKPRMDQPIDGYDYKPEDHSNKGSLRKEKLRQEAQDIFDNPKLTKDQKSFQLQRMIDTEKIHQNKFKPDKQRKEYLRDRMLNKKSESEMDKRFDKYTDGEYYTKT